jgi:hypothetical protein
MYTRNIWKKIRKIIPDTLASTDATANTIISSTHLDAYNKAIGENFSITIAPTTGDVYIDVFSTVATSSGYLLQEGDILDLRVESQINVLGNSTTAKFKALVWGDQ